MDEPFANVDEESFHSDMKNSKQKRQYYSEKFPSSKHK